MRKDHCRGFDLQLTQYDERGWRATFYTTDMEHSPTSATGTGWEPTPWHPTQRGAWEALARKPPPEFRSARLPASHPHEVRMRRIGLAVILVVSLILVPLGGSRRWRSNW